MSRLVSRNNRLIVKRGGQGPDYMLVDDGEGNDCCCLSCFVQSSDFIDVRQSGKITELSEDYQYSSKPSSRCHRLRIWEYRTIKGDAQGNATGFSGGDDPDHQLETTGRFFYPRHKYPIPNFNFDNAPPGALPFTYRRGPFYSGYDSANGRPDDNSTPLDQYPMWWPGLFPDDGDGGGIGGYASASGNGPSLSTVWDELLTSRDPLTNEVTFINTDLFDEHIGCEYHIFGLISAYYWRYNAYNPTTKTYSSPNSPSDGGYQADIYVLRSDLVTFAPGGGQ
ncbi:MAG: hypothetical protein AAGD32_17350 [Planctomycetota bacterium]